MSCVCLGIAPRAPSSYKAYSHVSALDDGGVWGGLRPCLHVKGIQKFLLGFAAMDPEVQRLVIGQLLVILVPVGILWFVWIRMLEK